jgi:hypothetical protein
MWWLMSDGKTNVVWPERFRVEAMDDDEREKWDRQIAEWDAEISDRPHIRHLRQKLSALAQDEFYYIERVVFGKHGGDS